jgi:Zn finger protein HypA/HybF involved in hydrogenase expression
MQTDQYIHPRFPILVQQILQRSPLPMKIQLVAGELIFSEEQARSQWRELVRNTPLEKAELQIRIVRAEQQCMVCFLKYHPSDEETACPQCKSVGAKILSGEEFYLELD